MPFTIGDNKTPWGGLYDEFDPRDAVPGTFKEMTNVVVGNNFSTIENRGGFVKWKNLPTAGDGTNTFNALSQTVGYWHGMAAAPNGDIYACVENGDIYKQRSGVGNFSPLNQTFRYWSGMCAATNGNVYACSRVLGKIYMQTDGVGDFEDIGQPGYNSWWGMCATPNGDVYACDDAGDIYKQTAGEGLFVALGETSRAWSGLCAAPNGDVYACVYNGDIYKQTGGAGAFTALSQTTRNWHGMATTANGDVYACVAGGDIYKQSKGVGNFIALSQTSRNYRSMTALGNYVYTANYDVGGNIYVLKNDNGLKAGMVIEKILHGAQVRVTRPSEQLITVLICLCSYQPSGGNKQYTWRVFQNPAYYTPKFGSFDSWQEKELFYIDIVETNKTLTRNTSPERFSFTITPPVNGGLFDGDLAGGYIYLEDAAQFSSPNLHRAEGDLIVENNSNDFNSSTDTLTLCTESAHATMWTTAGTDVVRYHKNLEDGFLPYSEIVSTSSIFFDQFTFSHFIEGETLHISINAGESGRASFEFRMNYIKRTQYSLGRLNGQSDYSYANGGNYDRYDRHLVYGFPGYINIIKNGANSFDGMNANSTGIIVGGSYDKITGKFTASINTQNYIIGTGALGDFKALNQSPGYWSGMTSLGGNVYACSSTGDIYMQTAGVGNFAPLSQTSRSWWGMTSANGNVYACVSGGSIYMQTGGAGNFVDLVQTSRSWSGMTSRGSDVYACVSGGDIYKQTGGAGNFVAIGGTSRGWTGMCTANGNIYACVAGGDIYMQTAGAGAFNALGQTSRPWDAMCSLGGDVYASTYNGDIYIQAGGVGDFVALGQVFRQWQALTSANGNVYAGDFNAGDIYMLSGSDGVFDLSIHYDDFFVEESDVHGRYGGFKNFNTHTDEQSSYITSNPQIAGTKYKPPLSGFNFSLSADGTPANASETNFTVNTFFYVLMCAIYNGFRYGLHSESVHGLNNASDLVSLIWCKVPASANKNIDGIAIVMAAGYASIAAITNQALLTDLRTVKFENLKDATGWDFYLCFPDGTTANGDTHQYVKSFRVDKSAYDTVNMGGDHLDLTANPSYSRKTTTNQKKKDILLSSDLDVDANGYSIEKQARYVMVGDYSFGAKTSIVIKNRLYFADVKYQEYQLGQIQSEIFEDNYNVFYSGIGQFGGNYHGFDFSQNKIACYDIGPVVAVNSINFPQGLEQVISHDRDALIVLGEKGVKFVDLSNNLLSSPVISSSPGDTCIARKSVVNENGILFCAGETGVYMFRGYEKIDITLNLHPKARIKKTWRELDRSKKQKAIGAFHRGLGYYILCIPDDNTFYVFDIQKAQAQ